MIALVMAGGNGKRLWPFVDCQNAKPFLSIIDGQSMLQAAYRRALAITRHESCVFVATSRKLAPVLKKQLPFLREENLIIEPSSHDTAPALGYCLAHFTNSGISKQETLVMLPGDNYLGQTRKYCDAIRAGSNFVSRHPEKTLLFGQKPIRADSSFGYIECGRAVSAWPQYSLCQLSNFVEKPNQESAQKLFENDRMWWSIGVYIWQVQNLWGLFQTYAPSISEIMWELFRMMQGGASDTARENLFEQFPVLSIDYAITEKQSVQEMLVMTGDYGWIDFGSWDEWARYFEGRATVSQVEQRNCRGNFVLSDGSVEMKLLGNKLPRGKTARYYRSKSKSVNCGFFTPCFLM